MSAHRQIELMTGSPDTPVYIRAINPKLEGGRSEERNGPLSDLEPWARRLNDAGANIYLIANEAPAGLSRPVRNVNIVNIRAVYVDADDSPEPASYHTPPTFKLVHPGTGRWWAFWTCSTSDRPAVTDHRGIQQRLAAFYGGDKVIVNPARVVRLAGFDRWKDGTNHGPYSLVEQTGLAVPTWAHASLPPVADDRPNLGQPSEAAARIALPRLRGVLACVDPVDRADWVAVGLALRDHTSIIGPDGKPMGTDVNWELFREWSSGDLHDTYVDGPKLKECLVGNFSDDGVESLMRGTPSLGGDHAGVGTVVALARKHMTAQGQVIPEVLCRPGPADQGIVFERMPPVDGASTQFAPDDATPIYYYEPGVNPYGGRSWLVHGLAPTIGVGIMGGEYAAGKTFLALEEVAAVGRGAEFAGFKVDKPGATFWLAAESEAELPVRMDALTMRDGVAPPMQWIDEVPAILASGGEERILGLALEARARFEAKGLPLVQIAVDTVLASAGFVDGNATAESQDFINRWKRIAKKLGVFVLLIDHIGKDAAARVMGSTAKPAGVDCVWLLRADRDKETSVVSNRRLVIDKVRAGESGIVLPFSLDQVTIGRDDKGRPITTGVVRWADTVVNHRQADAQPMETATTKPVMGRPKEGEVEVRAALNAVLDEKSSGPPGGGVVGDKWTLPKLCNAVQAQLRRTGKLGFSDNVVEKRIKELQGIHPGYSIENVWVHGSTDKQRDYWAAQAAKTAAEDKSYADRTHARGAAARVQRRAPLRQATHDAAAAEPTHPAPELPQ